MKAQVVWLKGSITPERYPAVLIEYGDNVLRHPRIWKVPSAAYADTDDRERTLREAEAIVLAINGKGEDKKHLHPQL